MSNPYTSSVTAPNVIQWPTSGRVGSAAGGRISPSPVNSDSLLVLVLGPGEAAPETLTESTPEVKVIPPGMWLEGSTMDPESQVFIGANSGTQQFACRDLLYFSPSGLNLRGVASTSSGGGSSPLPQPVANVQAPGSFALGVDWTIQQSVSGIYIPLPPGATCTLVIIDQAGDTATYTQVPGGMFHGINGPFTIRSAANGSIGVPPNLVVQELATTSGAVPSIQRSTPVNFGSVAVPTDWVIAGGCKELWIPLPAGAVCTLALVDQFGNTSVYNQVPGGMFPGLSGTFTVKAPNAAVTPSTNCPVGLIART